MFQKTTMRAVKFLCAAVSAAVVSGCSVNWYELPPDTVEAPAELIQNEMAVFNQRMAFRKSAYFVAKKPTVNYVNPWYGTVTPVQMEDQFTRQFGQHLVTRMGQMKDLNIVGLYAGERIKQDLINGAGSSFAEDEAAGGNPKKGADLLISYQVTGVSIQESAATVVARATTDIVGVSLSDRRAGHIVATSGRAVRLFYATVTANVEMVDQKTGRMVFSYSVAANSVPSPVCSLNDISSCMDLLAREVMRRYLLQFGPPIYVTESRNFGEMVQLNIGADYGVVPGMQFRFLTKNKQGQEWQIGTGYIQSGVPEDIGQNYTRVIVRGQGKPENFKVMKNILARPLY